MKKRIVICLASVVLGFSGSPVQAETVLEQIERTGVLKVAIREDAAPFGYLDANSNLQGYCLDFFVLLEKQLVKKLKRNSITVKLLKSTANNRFSLVEENTASLECGPNTIHSDPEARTTFSKTFFVTGTQFLAKQDNRDRLDLENDLKDIKIGVVKDTTTEQFIVETYPAAIVQKFTGNKARNRGIQAVEQGKIDGMISDGVLLRAEAQRQGLSAVEYPLIPETPLTCDRYGMILRKEDSQWTEFVNSIINSPATPKLSQAWFGQLFNYNLPNAADCIINIDS